MSDNKSDGTSRFDFGAGNMLPANVTDQSRLRKELIDVLRLLEGAKTKLKLILNR
jgi:hypothetical protein